MMKRAFALCVLLALLFTAGCAFNAKDIDLTALDGALADGQLFDEALEPIDAELGCIVYEVDQSDCETALFRFSSGATAEETALFKAKDKDALARIDKAVRARLDFQKDSFAGYIPAEVPKLDAALIETNGLYLAFCVAADAQSAKDVIDGYFK